MEISYSKLGELMACEATYQVTALGCRDAGLLLSREHFLGGRFSIQVTCDALIACAQAGASVLLILQKVPPSNGRAVRARDLN